MLPVLFIGFGLAQLGIAVVGTKNISKNFSWYALLILLVVYGLAYDNLAIAAGAFIAEGSALKAINWPRFAIHALFTPAMIISAFGMLRMSSIGFAQSRSWHVVICTIATVLILLGSYIDILRLDLVLQVEGNIRRYVNNFEFLPGPPIPAVFTILFVLVFGIVMWRRQKWPWMFAGALMVFLTAGSVDQLIVQNLGEVVFAGSLVATVIHTHRQ